MFAGQDQERYEPVTRRLRLNGQSTSIRLERSFWKIVDQIAAKEKLSTPAFISKLHAEVLEIHGEALISPRFFIALARSTLENTKTSICQIQLQQNKVHSVKFNQ